MLPVPNMLAVDMDNVFSETLQAPDANPGVHKLREIYEAGEYPDLSKVQQSISTLTTGAQSPRCCSFTQTVSL